MTGTVGANKDGSEFHGVAFDAHVYVGNTGGTDNTNYGPFQDPKFFYQTWSALAKDVADANKKLSGWDRGGFINNSFGTNTRVDRGEDVTTTGPDGGNTTVHLPTDTIQQVEYEYFLFQKYAPQLDAADAGYTDKETVDASGKFDFVDSAFKAAKENNVVQVFTTGNRDFANPFYRPIYPYFNPEAEEYWVAVAGMKRGSEAGTYTLYDTFNEAGLAKWWTVAAPGENIYGSKVDTKTGEALWGNSSGTSMAAPHVTGALAVLMSRYDQMDAKQVRDVMLTTATHRNPDGSIFDGWTADEGEVDERYGWGMPDLEKGMFGPGQLLGTFNYNMRDADSIDVWSNDISEIALNQRKAEEEEWVNSITKDGTLDGEIDPTKLGDYELGDSMDVIGLKDDKITKEDAEKWRKEYLETRVAAIKDREYDGSLVKQGEGTLVMTGDNSYEGKTTVEGGTLLAFAESIGDDAVTVEDGATFGILGAYTDDFTKTGTKVSKEAEAGKLTITLEGGAELYVGAGADIKVKTVDFGTNKVVKVGLEGAAPEALLAAYHEDDKVTGSFTMAEGDFSDVKVESEDVDSVFFKEVTGELNAEKTAIETKIVRDETVSFAQFATTKNERAIAEALEASKAGLAGEVLAMNEDEIKATYRGFSDDMYAAARNAMVVNALAVTHAVADQARGFGEGRTAELENGNVRLWATGMGYWGDAEGSESSLDVDFRAGLIGAEVNVCPATKLGAFFGAGTTDYKGNFGKIDGDDTHFGVYGLTDYAGLSFTYGVSYMTEDRDSQHVLAGNAYKHSEDASVLQAYAEAAYRFDVAGAQIDPYFGMSWARVESDGFAEGDYATKDREDDIQTATLGARVTMPFTMGTMPVAFKADAGWTHFFGDTEAVTELQLGKNAAFASLEAKELKDQFNVGLGLTAQVAKTATVGVSYTSSFGTDADTHGVMGTVKIAF